MKTKKGELRKDATKNKELPCPACGTYATGYDYLSGKSSCKTCHTQWTSSYVLTGYPGDTARFDEEDIGYPCFNSHDNSARYVTEYDYLFEFKKPPATDSLFEPVMWPESQKFMDLPDNLLTLCEYIMDEKGLEDFGSSAMWVPLCLLERQEIVLEEQSDEPPMR